MKLSPVDVKKPCGCGNPKRPGRGQRLCEWCHSERRGICSVPACGDGSVANGLCNRHYLRAKKYGDPLIAREIHDGKTRHPLYKRWSVMIERCHTVPTHVAWERYGGRGITVCDRWRGDFWAFVADMGECPPGLTLDRINPDGNYEPGNCRWADALTQRHNRRKVAA